MVAPEEVRVPTCFHLANLLAAAFSMERGPEDDAEKVAEMQVGQELH